MNFPAPVEFSLLDPEQVRDPYPVFQALRRDRPVHFNEELGGWLLTRYAEVEIVLRTTEFSVDTIRPFVEARESSDPDVARLGRLAPLWVVFNDPPDHTRLRSALNRGFTNRQVRDLEPAIRSLTDSLLAPLLERSTSDFVRDVAYPLPALVIAHMLGVPDHDVDQFKAWSDDIGEFVSTSTDPQRYRRASDAMEAMAGYFARLVTDRRRNPSDDLLSALVHARDSGVFMSDDELLSNCVLLLFAGHETTTSLLAGGLHHLAAHPDELLRLERSDPPPSTAIDELLRYDNPAHGLTRIAVREVAFDDITVRPGDRIFAFVTAANRDPEVFDHPERLDITRRRNPHLGFGKGIHYCLGAPLARLEASVAFPRILARLTNIEVTEPPVWQPLLVLRSLASLQISYDAVEPVGTSA